MLLSAIKCAYKAGSQQGRGVGGGDGSDGGDGGGGGDRRKRGEDLSRGLWFGMCGFVKGAGAGTGNRKEWPRHYLGGIGPGNLERH